MLGFENNEGIDISLSCKAKYTNEALRRVGKAAPKWTKFATYQSKYNRAYTSIIGVASMVKGVANFDFGTLIEGAN